MTQRLQQQEAILAALAGGATVVTAGARLARAVEWAFAEVQRVAGREAWERPRVRSWHVFLDELWNTATVQNAAALPQLLSPDQVEALWEQVIAQSGAASTLLQPLAAAQTAAGGWDLCRQYRLNPADFGAGSYGDDARQFSAWTEAFGQRCRAAGWLDVACLPAKLVDLVAAGRIEIPARVLFAGFDEWTPAQERLLGALQTHGCKVARLAHASVANKARRLVCTDAQHELQAVAHWAAAWLEREPDARVAIVVQDLATWRASLARTLDQTLCPSAYAGAEPARPYNFSLGAPLAGQPVIHDALLILRIAAQGRGEFTEVSAFLRSPFLAGADSEQAARLRLEFGLRAAGEPVSLADCLQRARAAGEVPQLIRLLTAVRDWARSQARRQLPSAWAHSFAELLQQLGWPGERVAESAEHQAVETFRDTLGALARLDVPSSALTMGAAVARCTRLAEQTLFQPASADVPIQVMGVLEASGLTFDHLWIAGWSDEVWPASPRPHPLIPAALQRQLGMPHASARRELEFAERATARLLASAPDVVVSAPARDADKELRPSPLIAGLPEVTLKSLPQAGAPAFAGFLFGQAHAFDYIEDARGPALAGHHVHGGTGILKSQAACPFQAFACYRLGAERLSEPGPGLDPMQRGSLVHDVLYRLFGELPDLATLQGLPPAELETLVCECVDAVLKRASAKQPQVFTHAFLALERERLLRLLRDWLMLERERAPFRVAAREYTREVRLGPLEFRTRVDRLDQLADGSYLLIDYKTGDAMVAAWQDDRPDEPQLPCYAVTADNEISAVSFAVLRPGAVAYRGYARTAGVAPGVIALNELRHVPDGCGDWNALLAHWRIVLEALAEAYAAGVAEVAPKSRTETCGRCHLHALCRIDEIEAQGDAHDE